MKWLGFNVELVSEYAKSVTWESRHNLLQDQLYLLAKQNRKLERLKGQVDWVITDSPLLLMKAYIRPDYYPNTFPQFVDDLYSSYDNINFFLERTKPYVKIGRSQTEDQAREIDAQIKTILIEGGYPYHTVSADVDGKHKIFEIIDSYK